MPGAFWTESKTKDSCRVFALLMKTIRDLNIYSHAANYRKKPAVVEA